MRIRRVAFSITLALFIGGLAGAAGVSADDAAAKLEQAQALFTARQFGAAEAVARDAVASSADPAILSSAADVVILCRLASGDFDGAEQSAQDLKAQIESASPGNDAIAYLARKVTDVQSKRAGYEQTITELQQTVAAHPSDESGATAAYQEGVVESQWGRTTQALEAFQRVVDSFGASKKALAARLAIGNLREGLADSAKAETEYKAVLAADPDGRYGSQAVMAIGNLYVAPNQQAKGLAELAGIAAAHPGTEAAACAYNFIGRIHQAAGKNELAEQSFSQALQEKADSIVADPTRCALAQVYYDKAEKYWGSGDDDAAATTMKEATALDVWDVNIIQEHLSRLLSTLNRLGRYAEVHQFAQAAATDPRPGVKRFVDAINFFDAMAYYLAGDLKTALEGFDRVASTAELSGVKTEAQRFVEQIKGELARSNQ